MQTYIHSDLRSYVGELFGTAIVRFLHYCTNNCLVLDYNKYTVLPVRPSNAGGTEHITHFCCLDAF